MAAAVWNASGNATEMHALECGRAPLRVCVRMCVSERVGACGWIASVKVNAVDDQCASRLKTRA